MMHKNIDKRNYYYSHRKRNHFFRIDNYPKNYMRQHHKNSKKKKKKMKEKKRKAYSTNGDSIWSAALADMQLIIKDI